MKNISDKEMILSFIKLVTDLKSRGINPGFYFVDNEESAALKMAMTTMYISYQLFPPSKHRPNNSDKSVQTFKNHFIAVLCSVDENFHLQLWERLLQQAIIILNLLQKSITLPHLSAFTHIFG